MLKRLWNVFIWGASILFALAWIVSQTNSSSAPSPSQSPPSPNSSDIAPLTPAQDAQIKKRREVELVEVLKHVPPSDLKRNRDLYSELTALNPSEVSYKRKLARYQKQISKAEDRETALEAKWGKAPIQSGWDGSYHEVEDFLKARANDPSSIDMAGCTEVSVDPRKGWIVGCKYRGKNAFGGLILTFNWFIIRKGRVVDIASADAYSSH